MGADEAWKTMQHFVATAAKAHSDGDYGRALDECRKGMVWLPALVKESEAEPWYREPLKYPILEHLLRLAPVALDRTSLEYILSITNVSAGLDPYRPTIAAALNHATRIAVL